MPKILHVITESNAIPASSVISIHRDRPDLEIDVFDLTAPDPDYADLLDRIFEADSVQVW